MIAAVVYPAALAPLNHAWMAIGKLLNRVVSPIVLALLFFGVVWPVGAVMRRTGGDALRLKKRPNIHGRSKESCWITRDPLANDHFTRQF
jgi:hypothetical protein